ncbi:hypothetical protein QAD02_001601 [Eretmocerus hayati]|uniref:Uncharacterized protein n=1 Tax=Eretmocerus hayati TaxID=131215 RepID=A0ACC2NGW4_9HYME|nr:hypothetical protein QAD02_001601 [Eretmocerus hayati]
MSSVSGDENTEVMENEPVRRTRSGRAVKAKGATPKKAPVKKTPARATRATRNTQQDIEEEHEEQQHGDGDNGVPENGLQSEASEDNDNLITDSGQEPIEEDQNSEQEVANDHQPVVEIGNDEELTNDYQEEMVCDTQEEDVEIENQEALVSENQSEEVSEEQEEPEEQEMDEEQDGVATSENIVEGETIPEFDPDEADQGTKNSAETIQAEVADSSTNDAPPEEMECSIRVKSSSEMMDEQADDQCILIEDEIDHQFELEETQENSNEESTKDSNKDTEYSHQDSEIILDNDEFRNQDVELISEAHEVATENQEVIEISDQESDKGAKKIEPDTEAVSEDELPAEATAKEPETEAVSDEELPAAQPADLGETESVSEDELPVESEKKKKANKAAAKVPEKKTKTESGKRKRSIEADDSSKSDVKPSSPKRKALPELEKYWKAVNDDPSDFTGWTYLLQYVDQENDAEAAREAYNKFLIRYPYCYGYWRKYADYEKKKGDPSRVQTVFDQGLKAISLSVDLWLHYINHCKVVHEKDEDKMREQYERAIKACGLEFRSDRLWESYIKWETENKRLSKVMAIYDRLLCTPTQNYLKHFESFQEFVMSNSPNKILNVDDFLAIRAEVKSMLKSEDTGGPDDAPPGEDPEPNESAPSDEETRAIRERFISSRRKMHKSNVNAVSARWTFEEGIKRPYFHVKPLERCQLKNWKEYLDFEIDQKDQTRIIILFERCLIACALYDEFWMRFVRYLESLEGDHAEKIRDVYHRACKVHHPKKPNLHLQWGVFEESNGDFDKAASILENIDSVIPNMLQVAYRRINLERRRGDLEKACSLYESYIASSKNKTIANNIVVKYARFLCKHKNDTDKAVKVLLKATEKDKDNPRLYLQLIDLGLQRNPIDVQEVVGYMDLFIDREHADAEQRVLFAQRKVEFLEDFSTDVRQVVKAHDQFQKCIKQAKDRKKAKSDESKVDATPPKKVKTDTSSVPTTQSAQSYQYSSSTTPYQSQQQYPTGQYSNQSGYQQSYQQYPPPSDPNYANYQNWQYSQSGPQAYNPYNQWGSYNYY